MGIFVELALYCSVVLSLIFTLSLCPTNFKPNKCSNYKKYTSVLTTLNDDGVLSGSANSIFSGYAAVEQREKIKKSGKEDLIKTILKDILIEGKLESSEIENADFASSAALKSNYKFTTTSFVNKLTHD